jgi:GTP pyrophosphokinase
MTDNHPSMSREDFLKIFILRVTPRAEKRISKAFQFSKRCHSSQTRDNKEPYHTHCVATALILCREWNIWDYELICAGLMHDAIEDKDLVDEELLDIAFSERVATMVDLVTKPKKSDPRFSNDHERHSFYFNRLDEPTVPVEVLILKAADRLHNLRTLVYCDQKKWAPKIEETRIVYLPLFAKIPLVYPELGEHIMSEINAALTVADNLR